MKDKMIEAHMFAAYAYASCSTAEKLNVGCVLVKDDRIISIGYNGMPSGWTNVCETEQRGVLTSKPEVLHAESNAICKLAKSTESGAGAVAFITHSPCLHCAKLLFQSGIVAVYYDREYRSDEGLKFLKASHIPVYGPNIIVISESDIEFISKNFG